MTRLTHSFSVEHAEAYGIECALLIHHFQFWIEQNQAMGRNFHDGRTWMYQTQKEIAAIYPYWSRDQVQSYLQKLEETDVIIKGNYNKSSIDRTTWYAFKNEEIFTKVRNRTNEEVKPHTPLCEIPRSIPYTKPYTKQIQQQHAAETAAVFSYKHLERTECSSEQEQQATSLSSPFLQHNINYQTLPDNSKNELTKQSSELNKSIYNKPSQQSGNSGQLKIYSDLKDIPIPEQEKVEITKRHSESVVKDAIAWATHPKNPPKKCLAASIKHACKHKYSAAEFSEPKKKVSVIEQIKRFFKHGEFYNNAECFVNYEYIAFQRGMRNESVRLDKYFSLDKFKNLCSSFQIKIPELA